MTTSNTGDTSNTGNTNRYLCTCGHVEAAHQLGTSNNRGDSRCLVKDCTCRGYCGWRQTPPIKDATLTSPTQKLYANLSTSCSCPATSPEKRKQEHYLYEKAVGAFQLAVSYGELSPNRLIHEKWGGALMLYIPMAHISKDSPDPSRTTISTLQYFLQRGGGVETFTLGYDVVGFWSTTEPEWHLAIKSMDLFSGLGLYPALFSVRPS